MSSLPSAQADRAVSSLGRAVRQRRRALGLTQQALARAAGCGLVFIYHLERGKPSLRLDKLLAILAVLGLDVSLKSRDVEVPAPGVEPARRAERPKR